MSAPAGSSPLQQPLNLRPRRQWKYKEAADKFHAGHNFARFSMFFNGALEKAMRDDTLTAADLRVLLGAVRFAWGHLADGCVDGYPVVDEDDRPPQGMTQSDLAGAIDAGQGTVSRSLVVLREREYLDLGNDGVYPNDQEQPTLFGSAKLRGTDPTNPLKSAKDSAVIFDVGNSASPFVRYKEEWFADHPEVASTWKTLSTERDKLYAEARAKSAELRHLDRQILGAFQAAKRAAARAVAVNYDCSPGSLPQSDSDSDGVAFDSNNEKFPQSKEKLSDCIEPDEPNLFDPNISPGVGARSFKLEVKERCAAAVPAVIEEQNTPPEAPQTAPEGSKLSGPASAPAMGSQFKKALTMEPREFHAELAIIFTRANKATPTRQQSAATLIKAAPDQRKFLDWLPNELGGIEHPGALPTLVERFKTWQAATAQLRSHAAAAGQAQPSICPLCSNSGLIGGQPWNFIQEAEAQLAEGLKPCSCEWGMALRPIPPPDRS